MSLVNRREFLKLSFASASTLTLASRTFSYGQAPAPGAEPEVPPFASLPRFIDRLPTLPRLMPTRKRSDGTFYHVRMKEFAHRMHSALPPTRVWGYEGQYPGPTIEAFRGEHIEVNWENQLPIKHLFKVDPHIHGAMPPAPFVRTVPHLHGSRSPSDSDGLPEKWFTPGEAVRYVYPNDQPAATLWYHDHALGITRLNVYAGLSGFYLLRDEEERGLGPPAGDYEVPLLVQDRTLDDVGQLVYSPTHEDGMKLEPGLWGPEFFGQLPVVNGAIFPFLDVEPRAYRLRILNGSNSRFFGLYLNLAKQATDVPSLVQFQQIGTDGGLLPRPVGVNHVLLGPAERADVIVDFSPLQGKSVTLMNNASAPYPGWGISGMHPEPLYELMQFRVTLPLAAKTKSFSFGVPSFRKLNEADAVVSRDFVLSERLNKQGQSLGVRINEKGYDEPITEIVKLGSIEKWRFINTTDDAHPMHLHLVQFQILHKQGLDPVELRKGSIIPVGVLRPPAANEAGWKDTAVVLPSEILTLLVQFSGYVGRYVFHCHMLEHEDNDMMRPYEVRA
jgi:spore coat protein A, manganese oxidase